MVSYEILPGDGCWRIDADGRRFGRFSTRMAAFECALRLACEVVGSGRAAEVIYTASSGERHSLPLTDCVPVEFASRMDDVAGSVGSGRRTDLIR